MSSKNQSNTAANEKAKENAVMVPDLANKPGQSALKDEKPQQKQSSHGADGAAAKGKAWDMEKQDTWLKCMNDHR
ncbi:MAG: hypothetical protein L6R41_000960 [Letrouitia leprolyta]|nr:MAG: hypothetical protein L6R41_000960 [Letrouitia leprolyta]